MRYLQLMYTYAPAWGFGGPSRMMYDYARWMLGAGVETLVIAGDVDHDYGKFSDKSAVVDGIPIERVTVFWRRLVRRSLSCVSPAMFLRALRYIRKADCVTVVHLAEFRSPVFLYAVALRWIFPRRVVLVYSAFGGLYHKASRLRRYYDALFMGATLRAVDLALVQNAHEARAYREYNAGYSVETDNVTIHPLHASRPRASGPPIGVSEAKGRLGLRAQHDIPAGAMVCIFLGRLYHTKGILRTIDAFLRFSASYPGETLLLVVGKDFGFQQQIVSHVERRSAGRLVRIVNDVYAERFDYYSLADVYLGFPTIFEETMLAAVEALACGTPVLVSREADMPYVEEEGAGFVIDFDLEIAAQRLASIAADPAAFRERALAVSERHFAEESGCRRFLSLIQGAGNEPASQMLDV